MELHRQFTLDMEIKNKLRKTIKNEYFGLFLLVILLLVTHFALVYQQIHPFFLFQKAEPQYQTAQYTVAFLSPDQVIFDEKHYVDDARSIINERIDPRSEHPPLGKLFIIAGIKLLGDNPWGWRFFPIIVGIIGIVFFYLVCRRLKMSIATAYIATFLLAFENQTFIQTQVAMLDVFLLPFMLISMWLYLRKNYLLSGIFIGLTALVKVNGILILLIIIVHWLIARRHDDWRFPGLIILAPVTFVGLLGVLEYFIWGHFTNPIGRIYSMMSGMSSLTFVTAAHPNMSRPWEWLMYIDLMPYAYYPHYMATISPTVWAMIIPSVIYGFYRISRGNGAALFALLWFAGTYLPWIVLNVLTDRITFVYYFFPTIGSICILIGLAIDQLICIRKAASNRILRRSALATCVVFLALHVVAFLALSPLTDWWKYTFFKS